MLWDKERQTWHDKLISDVVVPTSSLPPCRAGPTRTRLPPCPDLVCSRAMSILDDDFDDLDPMELGLDDDDEPTEIAGDDLPLADWDEE